MAAHAISEQPIQLLSIIVGEQEVQVAQEAFLPAGTKTRGLAYFQHLQKTSVKYVIGPVSLSGYGQVALAYLARQVKLKAIGLVGMGDFKNNALMNSPLVKKAESYGLEYVGVAVTGNGDTLKWEVKIGNRKPQSLSVTDNYKGSEYVSIYRLELAAKHTQSKFSRDVKYVPLGISDQEYIGDLAASLRVAVGNWSPKRLFVACGSGAILSALVQAWQGKQPQPTFVAVCVGRSIEKTINGIRGKHPGVQIQIINMNKIYAYDKNVEDNKRPPFRSLASYDAKAWVALIEHYQPGDCMWNVAG